MASLGAYMELCDFLVPEANNPPDDSDPTDSWKPAQPQRMLTMEIIEVRRLSRRLLKWWDARYDLRNSDDSIVDFNKGFWFPFLAEMAAAMLHQRSLQDTREKECFKSIRSGPKTAHLRRKLVSILRHIDQDAAAHLNEYPEDAVAYYTWKNDPLQITPSPCIRQVDMASINGLASEQEHLAGFAKEVADQRNAAPRTRVIKVVD
jgi:hypothetical protein